MGWEIPFDNLYKFIATVGIIILLLSFGLPQYVYLQNFRSMPPLLDSLEYNKQRLDEIQRSIRTHRDILVKLDSIKNDSTVKPIYNDVMVEYRQRLKDQMSYLNIVNSTGTLINYNNKIESQSKKAGAFGLLVGFIMVAFGFYKWYNHIQIYQDIKTKIEAGFDITHRFDSEVKQREINLGLFLVLATISFVLIVVIVKFIIFD